MDLDELVVVVLEHAFTEVRPFRDVGFDPLHRLVAVHRPAKSLFVQADLTGEFHK